MSEVAELLELLHGAGDRWHTVRLVMRRWGHRGRAGDAMRRYADRRAARGRSSGTAFGIWGGEEGPPTWEMVTRAWVDRPGDRKRVETSGPHDDRLTVTTGALWWSYSPQSGALSNELSPEVHGGNGGDFEWMLEPSSLLPALDFALTGSGTTELAGRLALTAVATPRPEDPRRGFATHIIHGADEVFLAVDAERGVVLRSESRIGGEPFTLFEMDEVTFDEELPDERFRFVSPDGSPVRSPRSMFSRPEPMSVEEAARRAHFTVLVPTRLPQGWTLHASYTPPSSRPARPESVTVHAVDAGRRESRVQINQSAVPLRDGLEWEIVEHGGRRISTFVNDAPGSAYEGKVEISGTHVRASGNLDRDAFLDILASLAPGPTALPPFVDL